MTPLNLGLTLRNCCVVGLSAGVCSLLQLPPQAKNFHVDRYADGEKEGDRRTTANSTMTTVTSLQL